MSLSLGLLGLSISSPLARSGGRPAYDPASLFVGGKTGTWYDPSDMSTLFRDDAGTISVTTDGQTVGYMADKSGNNNHVTMPASADRPTFRKSGGLSWLQFDGLGDVMQVSSQTIGVATVIIGASVDSTSAILGLFTNIVDDNTAVDFVYARDFFNAGIWDNLQGVGEGVSNAMHKRVNGAVSGAIVLGVPTVYSATAVGYAQTPIRFGSGLRIGNDRTITNRNLNGKFYGSISVGNSIAQILTDQERAKAEAWMATKIAA